MRLCGTDPFPFGPDPFPLPRVLLLIIFIFQIVFDKANCGKEYRANTGVNDYAKCCTLYEWMSMNKIHSNDLV